MIQVIENFAPATFADSLENLCKTEMPWYWSENTSGANRSLNSDNSESNFQFGFNHIAMFDTGYKSEFFDKIIPLVYFMEEKTGIAVKELYRIRLALNPWTAVETKHHPHVDDHRPHKVLLYYVNDSDGDTFMYNEMFEIGKPKPENFTIRERISPQKNKAVVFDGHIFHSSSKPNNHASRFIVNIDFN
jgi:hypothetical protein